MKELTPQAIVKELDKYIIGQEEAKRAVAVALRTRERRRLLPPEVRHQVVPKNLLMIGPTGVGKTEIARRVAEMVDAPFVKVEATKFTEVGYVGRDVDSIISDLVEVSINKVHETKLKEVGSKAQKIASEKIVGYLCQQWSNSSKRRLKTKGKQAAITLPLLSTTMEPRKTGELKTSTHIRRFVGELFRNHQLDDELVEIELKPGAEDIAHHFHSESPEDWGYFMDPLKEEDAPRKWRKVSVKEAQRLLTREEASKLMDFDQVVDDAIRQVEENGVVFLDEMDKLGGPKVEMGRDISGEGVQRDLLPIVEGTVVMTRYGQVKTDHILFVAAGSFYHSKPSDLIPELQGRFPLRVELISLTQQDLERILIEPQNALTKQYQALLDTEGVKLTFTPEGIKEIAYLANVMNERVENIGARRLYTITEKVLEEVSFSASERKGEEVVVDAAYVRQHIGELVKDEDLSRYIL